MMVECLLVAWMAAIPVPQSPPTPPTQSTAPTAPVEPSSPRTIEVHSGLAWHLTAMDAKPGDVILLEKGIHINGRIEGLHGTREKPIIIRGADPEIPSAISCEQTGLELIRCSWVRIENLYFMNPQQVAIVIDGSVPGVDGAPPTASDVSIAISSCRISTSREMPGLDAVHIVHARTVGIADCIFESWSDAAIEMRHAASVVVTRCRFSPVPHAKKSFGIRVLDGCDMIAVLQNSFDLGIGTGIQIGACEQDGEALVANSARQVHVLRSTFLDVECPLEIAGDSDATMRWCTAVEPTTGYRIDARCGEPRLVVAASLFQWTPGRLLATTERRGDAIERSVKLEANLWWSDELPAALEVIGKPFGEAIAPQVMTVDPRLADRTLQPLDPAAHAFGWMAPQPQPSAADGSVPGNGSPGTPASAPPPAAPPQTAPTGTPSSDAPPTPTGTPEPPARE